MDTVERKQETKAVKDALKAAGINSRVEHGKGTAWSWLEINVGSADQFGEHTIDEYQSHISCKPCQKIHEIEDRALKITLEVTGRGKHYNHNICMLTQKHWNKSTNQSEEIYQS